MHWINNRQQYDKDNAYIQRKGNGNLDFNFQCHVISHTSDKSQTEYPAERRITYSWAK